MPKYTYRQQMLSTRVVADIARQVNEEMIDKLIDRRYLFGKYNPNDNLWLDLNGEASDTIGWEGHIEELSDIRKTDTVTVTNDAVVDDPDTARNETQQAEEDGFNVLVPTAPMHGRRSSDQINVYALSALLRLAVVPSLSDIPESNKDELINDQVRFKYGFYLWRKITSEGILDDELPDIKTLIKWKPFGYSAQLDNIVGDADDHGIPYATKNLEMLLNSEHVRCLAKGDCTIHVPNAGNAFNIRTKRIYHKLKTPISINYVPDNIEGDKTTNFKLFFAIQTDVPTAHLDFLEPRAQACTKVYYTSKL